MAAALPPLPRHLPPLPLPSGLDQVQITQASGKAGEQDPIRVLGFGFETSPRAALAGGQGGWEAAMPTWVITEEQRRRWRWMKTWC